MDLQKAKDLISDTLLGLHGIHGVAVEGGTVVLFFDSGTPEGTREAAVAEAARMAGGCLVSYQSEEPPTLH